MKDAVSKIYTGHVLHGTFDKKDLRTFRLSFCPLFREFHIKSHSRSYVLNFLCVVAIEYYLLLSLSKSNFYLSSLTPILNVSYFNIRDVDPKIEKKRRFIPKGSYRVYPSGTDSGPRLIGTISYI